MKKGKKFGSGGATKKPMMESDRKPIDVRRAILGSDKDIVARGNRTPYEPIPKSGPDKPKRKPLGRAGAAGYAKGGKVKKYALGGNLAGGPTTTTPTQSGSGNASSAIQATANAAMNQMAGRPDNATPTKAASPTTSGLSGTSGVQLAAGKTPVSTVSTAAPKGPAFDRNVALQTFNSKARDLMNRGVPKAEIIKQQALLRKLQMDNSSTSAQHQDALNRAMGSLMGMMNAAGKRAAKGGVMETYAAGGLASGHKGANGIAKKGKTKAMQVKMNKGGACYAKGGSVRGIDGIAMKGKTRCKGAK